MSYSPPPPPPPPPPMPPLGGVPPEKPDSYLVWSILTTLFCCLPFGIAAIVQSAKVDSLWTVGQYAAARKASDDAKKWCLIGVAAAAALLFVYVALTVLPAVVGSVGS